jgi:hypothetical protein
MQEHAPPTNQEAAGLRGEEQAKGAYSSSHSGVRNMVTKKKGVESGGSIDKTSGPRKRAGHTLERIAKASASRVGDDVLALLLTGNSWRGHSYSAEEIPTLVKVYDDCGSGVGLTKVQVESLIGIQRAIESENDSPYAKPVKHTGRHVGNDITAEQTDNPERGC